MRTKTITHTTLTSSVMATRRMGLKKTMIKNKMHLVHKTKSRNRIEEKQEEMIF